MPAYSFQKQFVEAVESGAKTHTIRGKRKHRPKVGQRFVGYYAQRTKQCRKLIESTITRVQGFRITVDERIFIDDLELSTDEIEALARRDGFAHMLAFFEFWDGRRPFEGDLIHWKEVR